MADPTEYGQPDRMTSALYTDNGPGYSDSGGVHTNSGVGNKAAYLISQGGTFNGRAITGIDAGDPSLDQTAVLYYDVIRSLISSSDYADLADVLEQSCADLAAAGTSGFTVADCASVRAAVLATEMRTDPPNASRPADAPDTCPVGTKRRVLFDSETGDAATKLTTDQPGMWGHGSDLGFGTNATSGTESWFGRDPDPEVHGEPYASSLRSAGIAVPAGQPTYLHFQNWWVYEWGVVEGSAAFYDGGTVEVDDLTDTAPAQQAAPLPWLNGPNGTLAVWDGNPHGALAAFVGDSHGWTTSRVDLSSYAGKYVGLQFTTRGDMYGAGVGWYLDDIRVYTCDPVVSNTAKPKVSGTPKVGKTLTAKPGAWAPSDVALTYAWLRNGKAVKGATKPTYKLVTADQGKKLSVRVTGTRPNVPPVAVTSAAVGPVKK